MLRHSRSGEQKDFSSCRLPQSQHEIIMRHTPPPLILPESYFFLSVWWMENPAGCMNGDNISGEPWPLNRVFFNLSLNRDPRPELLYFIVQGLNFWEQYTWMWWTVFSPPEPHFSSLFSGINVFVWHPEWMGLPREVQAKDPGQGSWISGLISGEWPPI